MLLRKIFSELKAEIEKFRLFLVQKSRKVLNLWDFLENVNGSHRERNKKKLVDTNRMRLLELRMKKELVNNNRRLCYC